ncbi:MAG: hypothetical protein ACI87W_002079 [Halieaceae bacterium]|jgi:hypothetical protein
MNFDQLGALTVLCRVAWVLNKLSTDLSTASVENLRENDARRRRNRGVLA